MTSVDAILRALSLAEAGLLFVELDDEARVQGSPVGLAELVGAGSVEALRGRRLDELLRPEPRRPGLLCLPASTGPARWFSVRSVPHPSGAGVIAALVDVTEEHARAEALEAFEACVEHSPDAIFWTRGDGSFAYVNQEACRSLGYGREELLRLSLADVDPDFAAEAFPRSWREYEALPLGGMATRRIETVHRRQDGSTFPVEVLVRHRRSETGHFHAAFVRDASASRRAERQLHLMNAALERAGDATYWTYPDGRIFHVNEAACTMLGYTREALCSMTIYDVDPEYPREAWLAFWGVLQKAKHMVIETTHQRRDGHRFPVEVVINYVRYEGEEFSFGVVRDLTEARRIQQERLLLESQLRQAQKMEAIGRLAGGVAHDFNNMLGVILGYCDMLKEDLQDNPDAVESLLEIEHAAQRSRDTTRQLLAFSRRQAVQPRVLDVNRHIQDAEKSLRRVIHEDVRLVLELGEALGRIHLDPAQLDQVLMNLAVNARDAMPSGGHLWISTRNHEVTSASTPGGRELSPGRYVCITVRDDGRGMDDVGVANAFEPFFTTKGAGQGSGLGLATVYGIVHQGGGAIALASRVGEGTRVEVYLPVVDAEAEDPSALEVVGASLPGRVVVVVEDEPSLRRITAAMLRELGYVVHTPESTMEALGLCLRPDVSVDLVISDVIMPDMHGPALEAAVRARRPELPFLFISGYPAEVTSNPLVAPEAHLLLKPFTRRELAREVAKALARASAG
jgi:two-component system cell cycle sensor histidine kinase/response regulator CckA